MRWARFLQMPIALFKNFSARQGAGAISWGLLLFLSLIWGSSFILIKKSLVVYSPGEVGALRIITAALALLPLGLKHLSRLSRRHMALLLLIGFVGSFLPAFLFAKAQTQLASSVTGILNALTPLFVVVMGALFFNQKFTRRNTIGLIISFAGCVILVLAGSEGQLGEMNFYAFFVMAATICYGINLNVIKAYLADLRPITITAVSLLFVAPLALSYLFGLSAFSHKLLNQEGAGLALLYVSILGVVGTSFALIFFNKLVQLTNPMFTSFVTYLIPIVAVFWGVIDGESLFLPHYLGMITIIGGVYIAQRRKKAVATPIKE